MSMTGPELFKLGSSIVDDLTSGKAVCWDGMEAGAALAQACFAGAQAAAFAVMAATELDGEGGGADAMAQAWARVAGLDEVAGAQA